MVFKDLHTTMFQNHLLEPPEKDVELQPLYMEPEGALILRVVGVDIPEQVQIGDMGDVLASNSELTLGCSEGDGRMQAITDHIKS